jgi:hypothetical protein
MEEPMTLKPVGLTLALALGLAPAAFAQSSSPNATANPGSQSSSPTTSARERRSVPGNLPQSDAAMNPFRPQGAPQAAVAPSGVAPPVAPQSGVVTPRGLTQSDAAANRGAPATSAPTRPSAAVARELGEVRQVQQALQSRGYEVGPVDGVMGEQTQRALRRFQREEGMIITGDVTLATRAALGIGASTQEERAAQLRAAAGAGR